MSADELKALGNAAFGAKDFKAAAELYTQALAVAPDSAVLFSNRAAAYSLLGKVKKALADAQRCVALDPTFVKGHARNARALFDCQQYGEALAACDAGLALDASSETLRALRRQIAETQAKTEKVGAPLAKAREMGEELLRGWNERNAELGAERQGHAIYSERLAAQVAFFRNRLQREGATDMATNDADPHGDGDQSLPRTMAQRGALREIWCNSADVNSWMTEGRYTPLCMACYRGERVEALAILRRFQNAIGSFQSGKGVLVIAAARAMTLEVRESSLRLPPLLLLFCGSRSVRRRGQSTEDDCTERLAIMHALLAAGARPGVRDVTGKTAVHYGMGSMATPLTIALAEAVIEAHEAQRAEGEPRLVDVQDRMGTVALHELIPRCVCLFTLPSYPTACCTLPAAHLIIIRKIIIITIITTTTTIAAGRTWSS
jgi:tetratricopeptide (TPR) repeat protein